ncbi:MAG TPA: ATP-binding protein [Vicinamibacterales bacterium]|nr:ATP-binding protein [Vicinamibacterales bacterium]
MLPFATIGVISALLVWEIEHVGSITLAVALGGVAIAVAVLVARRVRSQIDELAAYYESLLKKAEDESTRAEEAGRIKDEFLSTLSHELRTPLNSVLGWARLLAGGKLNPVQSAKAIQAIERAGWAQSRLIEDLLDLSRIVGGRLRLSTVPTLMQPIIGFVLQTLAPAAEAKGITVETQLDPGIGPVAVDPDRLQQIVWHLVSNAIKFTLDDGRVEVTLALRDAHILLTVSDSGVGFAEDTAAILFERLRQGDSSSTRSYGGLGVGLGIVRHLVELHGGTISAHSDGPNRGATFEVLLPQRAASAAAIEPPQPVEPSPLLQGVSVLVVDDDAAALEFAKSSLEQYGASVSTALSASEAHDLMKAEAPDVLLSDLRMPGGDGLQFIREVRALDNARGRRTPAAALTALARSSDRRDALAAGYQMHVAKPIDPFELAAAVEQLVRAG